MLMIESQYEKILKLFRTTSNPDERNTCLRSLGRAKDPELIQRTLGMLFSSEVKDQDVYLPATGLRSHPEGVDALFNWMTANWEELYKKLPPGLSMLSAMVSILTSSFTTPAQLARVEKFFAEKNNSGYDQSLAQSMDSIRSKIAWVKRDHGEVAEWLKANGYSG